MTLRKQNGSWVRTLYIAPSLVSVFTGGRPAGRVCLSVVVVLGLSVRRRRRVGSVCRRRAGSVCRRRRTVTVTLATDTSVGIRRAVSVPQTPPCQLQRR